MSSKKHVAAKGGSSPTPPTASLAPKTTFWSNPNFAYWVILILAFVLYGNTLGHDYALDDSIVITDNKYTKEGVAGLGKIFTTDAFEGFFGTKKDLVAGGRYRPLSIATFAMEWAIAPKSPGLSHFINVVLYACCGILVLALLRTFFPDHGNSSDNPYRTGTTRWWLGAPFLITVLFMVHPIHTEVVANIKGRDELMALLFLLGGMLASFRYLDKEKLHWLGVSMVCFFLALLSKETPLPFVVLLPLSIWFFRKPLFMQGIMASLPFIVATGLYILIRMSVVGFSVGGGDQGTELLNNPFLGVTKPDKVATVLETWGIYLYKLLLPIQLNHDYYPKQIPITHFGDPLVIASLLVNLGLLAAGTVLTIRKNPIGYGILFFYISFSITSNLVIPIGTLMGERFVFVSSLGFLIALVFLLKWLGQRFHMNRAAIPVVLLVAVAFPYAIKTVTRNPVWKDNYTLFTTDVKTSPNSAKVQTAAGGVLIEQSEKAGVSEGEKQKLLRQALVHLDKAVKIYPQHGQAYLLMGNAYHNLGDYPNSLRAYQNAMRERPLLWDAYRNAQITARKIKDYALASAFFKLELDRKTTNKVPVTADFWFDRGSNYEDWGARPDSAIWAYGVAFEKDPKMAKALGQTGRVYGMQLQNYDKAIAYGERALAIDPKLEWVYENVGISHAMKGDFASSLAAFQRGLKVNPSSAKLHLNLALTYQNMGDLPNAQAEFARAFELDPSLKR